MAVEKKEAVVDELKKSKDVATVLAVADEVAAAEAEVAGMTAEKAAEEVDTAAMKVAEETEEAERPAEEAAEAEAVVVDAKKAAVEGSEPKVARWHPFHHQHRLLHLSSPALNRGSKKCL